MPERTKVSRRDFLKVTFASIWGFVLAACKLKSSVDETPTPAATDTNTPEPESDSASNAPQLATETPTATPTSTPEPCFALLEPKDKSEVGSIGRITF